MNKRVLVLGDSISLGYGLESEEHSYVKIIENNFGVFIDVIAECGQTVGSQIKILESSAIHEAYDITIIFLGSNGTASEEEFERLFYLTKAFSNKIIICTVPIKTENNDIIYAEYKKHGMILCDINQNWHPEYFLPDNIHPNIAGHSYISKALANLLVTQ